MKFYQTKLFYVLIFLLLFGYQIGTAQTNNNNVDIDTTFQSSKNDSSLNVMPLTGNYSLNFASVAIRAFVSLIFIIALIFLIVFLIKKFFYSNNNQHFPNDSVAIMGHVPLSPKNSIYLIKIVNKILVVGSTEKSINHLSTIEDEAVISKLENNGKGFKNHPISFNHMINKMLRKQINE